MNALTRKRIFRIGSQGNFGYSSRLYPLLGETVMTANRVIPIFAMVVYLPAPSFFSVMQFPAGDSLLAVPEE